MIAKALRENVNFMWIAGVNQPDFRTVNRFRLQMKDIIQDVFFKVVKTPNREKLYQASELLFGWHKD